MAGMSRKTKTFNLPLVSRWELTTFLLFLLVALAVGIAGTALGDVISKVASGQWVVGVPVAVVMLFLSLMTASILFGVAEIIDYMRRTTLAIEAAAKAANQNAELMFLLIESRGLDTSMQAVFEAQVRSGAFGKYWERRDGGHKPGDLGGDFDSPKPRPQGI